jgi:hypothetical protein
MLFAARASSQLCTELFKDSGPDASHICLLPIFVSCNVHGLNAEKALDGTYERCSFPRLKYAASYMFLLMRNSHVSGLEQLDCLADSDISHCLSSRGLGTTTRHHLQFKHGMAEYCDVCWGEPFPTNVCCGEPFPTKPFQTLEQPFKHLNCACIYA